jgi:hypothetical protein
VITVCSIREMLYRLAGGGKPREPVDMSQVQCGHCGWIGAPQMFATHMLTCELHH